VLQKPKITNKKFYNKFIYKVSLKLPGARALRLLSYAQIINFISVPPPHSHYQPVPNRGYMDWRVKVGNTIHNNAKTWSKIISLFSGVPKKDLSFRVEGESVDVYTNDVSLYNEVSQQFNDITLQRSQPAAGMEDILLNSTREIFVDKLPYGRYNYRVDLKWPTKLAWNDIDKLCNFFEAQRPRITFTESIKKWFYVNRPYMQTRRYIYVQDEQTLMLLKLRCSDNIGTVCKYVETGK